MHQGTSYWAVGCLAYLLSSGTGCQSSDDAKDEAEDGIIVTDEPDESAQQALSRDARGIDYFSPASMPSKRGAGSGRAVTPLPMVNVPECDRLLKSINDCYMPRLSDEQQVKVLNTLKPQYSRWSSMAAVEQRRSQAAAECRQALDSRRAVFAIMGC